MEEALKEIENSYFCEGETAIGEEVNPLSSFWLEGDSLAPPCQSDFDVVKEILLLARPQPDSVLCDLGCGDGRICLSASKLFGCKSFGCEIEPSLVQSFESLIQSMSLSDKVTAIGGDLQEIDFSSATIIILYLLSESIELIKPKLKRSLRTGTRLICNTWGPKGFTPVKTVQCGKYNNVNLYLYDDRSLSEDEN